MPFGQIVIGPPGSGKSTYCNGAHQFLNAIGRKTIIVNLDPANEQIPYDCAINIQSLISLDSVMQKLNLGPNGAMIYCMEYLSQHSVIEWLKNELQPYTPTHYVLFDMPGQIELYTHYSSVKQMCESLVKDCDFRLAAVNLVDAHYCSNPSNFISVLLVSLSTMINLELPHINVLSKVDMIEHYGKLAFDIDYYTDVQDLSYLVDYLTRLQRKQRKVNYNFFKGVTDEVDEEEEENVTTKKQKVKKFDSDNESSDDDEDEDGDDENDENNPISALDAKFTKLNQALVEVIQDFSLVSFVTLHVEDKNSIHKVLQWADKANGYVFGACEKNNASIMEVAMSQLEWNSERNDFIRRNFMSHDDDEEEEDGDDNDDEENGEGGSSTYEYDL